MELELELVRLHQSEMVKRVLAKNSAESISLVKSHGVVVAKQTLI